MRIFRAYALAIVSVTIALLLTLFIPSLGEQFGFLLFFLAVFAGATGGVGPGVFATILSMAMVDYFLIPPLHSFAISDPKYLFPVVLFCVVGFVITWITHRRQRSEETLQAAGAVIESAADSIMRQGLDNTILSWNKASERTYGYTANEATGRSVSLIVPPDRWEEFQHQLERARLGDSLQSFETVRVRKDGTHIDVAMTLSSVRKRKGKIIGVSSITREITGQKQAEQAIKQSHVALERQMHHLKLLAEMGDMLQASSVPADAYAVAGRFAHTLFPESSGTLFVRSVSGQGLEVVTKWGDPHPNEQDFMASEDCWALRTGLLHLVEDSSTGLLCRHLPAPPPACYVCAPMIARGTILGLLHLRLSRCLQASFGEAQPESLELTWVTRTMAERLALSLAEMELLETLRAQSIRDPLTGWFNRRFMEETLEREIRRAVRNKRPLAIIMLDVDNFKDFNDSFGHEAGDLALQNLCRTLEAHVRGEDIACRFGGDEFVLVLPDTSVESAARRAEEMRVAVGHVEIQSRGQLLWPMTLCFGIAAFPANGRSAKELLRAADVALLRAKAEGRDRVRSQEHGFKQTGGN